MTASMLSTTPNPTWSRLLGNNSEDRVDSIADETDPWDASAMINFLTTIVVPLVFGIIVFVGIIGNALVIMVVVRNRQMRNTTNVLILNLAVADLCFIVLCVPFTAVDYAYNSWPFGLTLCQSVQYLIYVTSYVSIYTLILMAFDRFLAVVCPVSAIPYRTVRNAFLATVVTWSLISAVASPIWFAHHLQPKFVQSVMVNETESQEDFLNSTLEKNFELVNATLNASEDDEIIMNGDNYTAEASTVQTEFTVMTSATEFYWCRFSDDDKFSASGFYIAFFISGYAIPLVLIVLMYIFMLNRLWHPVGHQKISQEALRNKRRVTKLVMIVIIVFAVCWAPIQFVLLLKGLGLYNTRGPQDFVLIIFQVFAHVLAYLNSCVNPILYAFLSDNFRKAFYQLLPYHACTNPGVRNEGQQNGGTGVKKVKRSTRLQYELTTLRASERRDSSPIVNGRSSISSGNGACSDTRRYGKRGRLVKHERSKESRITQSGLSLGTATVMTTSSSTSEFPLGEAALQPVVSRRIEVRTFIGESGLLCTEL